MRASQEDQERLLELQAIDTKLTQLDHRAASLPQTGALREIDAARSERRAVATTERGTLEDAEAELSRVEADVAVVESRIARDTARVSSSSSVKDVTALEQELAALAKRLGDLEEIELAVMQRVEDQQGVVEMIADELRTLDDRATMVGADRDAALSVISSERAAAAAERERIGATVPAELLALYERQRARYGTGASLLRGGVSLASGVRLLENELQEIRAADPEAVIMCASSEAILVRTAESGL